MTKRAFFIEGIGFGLLTAGLAFYLSSSDEIPQISSANASVLSHDVDRAPASLGRPVLADLRAVLETESREKEFLVGEVGLSENEYAEVKQRQLDLYQQLTLASQQHPSDVVTADRYRKSLVKNHIRWMNRAIGRENYEQLQKLTQLPVTRR
jgi:hypothetical protein